MGHRGSPLKYFLTISFTPDNGTSKFCLTQDRVLMATLYIRSFTSGWLFWRLLGLFLLVAHLTTSPGGCPCARISGEALWAQGGRFRITPTIAVTTATSLPAHCPPLPRECLLDHRGPPRRLRVGVMSSSQRSAGVLRYFPVPSSYRVSLVCLFGGRDSS